MRLAHESAHWLGHARATHAALSWNYQLAEILMIVTMRVTVLRVIVRMIVVVGHSLKIVLLNKPLG